MSAGDPDLWGETLRAIGAPGPASGDAARFGAGGTAVRAARRPARRDGAVAGLPPGADFLPTPPWATRALIEHVLPRAGWSGRSLGLVWEPCAGLRHMADVLEESALVTASDAHAIPCAAPIGPVFVLDFLTLDVPSDAADWAPDWIVTNPPFRLAEAMAHRAIDVASAGVALLLRLQWLEGVGRWRDLFCRTPPTLVAPFTERVAMCEGGWDPDLASATAYAWFVWMRGDPLHGGALIGPRGCRPGDLDLFLIPPCRAALTRPDDRARFAGRHPPGWISPTERKRRGMA